MAAVVIAIAHKHTFCVKEKNILTIKAVFVNHLPRIGILNGNNDSTGRVRGGRMEFLFYLFFWYSYGFFVAIHACFHLVGII